MALIAGFAVANVPHTEMQDALHLSTRTNSMTMPWTADPNVRLLCDDDGVRSIVLYHGNYWLSGLYGNQVEAISNTMAIVNALCNVETVTMVRCFCN